MTDTKFTPGSWRVDTGKQERLEIRGDTFGIALVYGKGMGRRLSDAHLIAAAPELYAALVETLAVATQNEEGEFADRARSALAKARGETP